MDSFEHEPMATYTLAMRSVAIAKLAMSFMRESSEKWTSLSMCKPGVNSTNSFLATNLPTI